MGTLVTAQDLVLGRHTSFTPIREVREQHLEAQRRLRMEPGGMQARKRRVSQNFDRRS
jgi:hypothetical protein